METVVIMVIIAILGPGLAVPFGTSRHAANNFSNLGGENNRQGNSINWDESHTPVEGALTQYREDQLNADEEESSQLLPALSNEVGRDTSDYDSSLRNDDDNDGDDDEDDDDEDDDEDDDYDRESESNDGDGNEDSDELSADRDQDQLPTDEATADSVNQ